MPDLAPPLAFEPGAAVAAGLWAALRTFGRIPGARVIDQPDVTLVLSRTPFANFNNVIASAIEPADAGRRIPEILAACAPDSLPVTWWAGPTTKPSDLVSRLQRLGLARQAPEFAMALEVSAGWPEAALPPGATLEHVAEPAQLDEWLGVMNAAYGWPEPDKTAIVRSMYLADLALPESERDIKHFLVRFDGVAAACSSLFTGGGEAFVTNIGTSPGARGRGLGTVATVATLDRARALGRNVATLTASVDGRGVYRRLGFRESGVLERYVAGATTVQRRDRAAERGS